MSNEIYLTFLVNKDMVNHFCKTKREKEYGTISPLWNVSSQVNNNKVEKIWKKYEKFSEGIPSSLIIVMPNDKIPNKDIIVIQT